jgi:hypothetical protein
VILSLGACRLYDVPTPTCNACGLRIRIEVKGDGVPCRPRGLRRTGSLSTLKVSATGCSSDDGHCRCLALPREDGP